MANHGVKESEFKAFVVRRLRAAGFYVQAIETYTTNGVPDLFVLAPDKRAIWIELKVSDKPPLLRKEQRLWHQQYAEAGGKSLVMKLDPITNNILTWLGSNIEIRRSTKYLEIINPPHVEMPSTLVHIIVQGCP
jgi:hypothetical protein